MRCTRRLHRAQPQSTVDCSRCSWRSLPLIDQQVGQLDKEMKDFPDAERPVKRLVANELSLSFVPDTEQRLWRTVMGRKYQLTRNRVQLQNRWEALLEEAHPLRNQSRRSEASPILPSTLSYFHEISWAAGPI